jgi:hypothetical protein
MMVKIRGYLLGGSGNHGLTSKYEAYQQESIIVHDDMNRVRIARFGMVTFLSQNL